MRLGLIGPPDDAEVQRLGDRLDERGVETLVLDLTTEPDELDLTLTVDEEPSLSRDGEPLDDVDAWYARRLGLWDPTLPEAPTREEWSAFYDRYDAWHAAETERAILAGSILEILHDRAAIVNPPRSIYEHLRKSHQIWRMVDAGIRVPAFQVTTDPDAAEAFAREHDRVVYKPGAGRRHVLEVTPETIRERREAFDTEPVMLQRLVEGEHHRVHVVADRLVAAGRMDFDKQARIDYRHSETDIEAVELPEAIETACRRAMEACGMSYTGLDLILDDAGEAWFLECNPAAMFATFEDRTGYPISERLADHLIAMAER